MDGILQAEDIFILDTEVLEAELAKICGDESQNWLAELIRTELSERQGSDAIISALSGSSYTPKSFSFDFIPKEQIIEPEIKQEDQYQVPQVCEQPLEHHSQSSTQDRYEKYAKKPPKHRSNSATTIKKQEPENTMSFTISYTQPPKKKPKPEVIKPPEEDRNRPRARSESSLKRVTLNTQRTKEVDKQVKSALPTPRKPPVPRRPVIIKPPQQAREHGEPIIAFESSTQDEVTQDVVDTSIPIDAQQEETIIISEEVPTLTAIEPSSVINSEFNTPRDVDVDTADDSSSRDSPSTERTFDQEQIPEELPIEEKIEITEPSLVVEEIDSASTSRSVSRASFNATPQLMIVDDTSSDDSDYSDQQQQNVTDDVQEVIEKISEPTDEPQVDYSDSDDDRSSDDDPDGASSVNGDVIMDPNNPTPVTPVTPIDDTDMIQPSFAVRSITPVTPVDDDDDEPIYRVTDQDRQYLASRQKEKRERDRIQKQEQQKQREYSGVSLGSRGKTAECNPKILKQYLDTVKETYEEAFNRSGDTNKKLQAVSSLLAPPSSHDLPQKLDYSSYYTSFSDLVPGCSVKELPSVLNEIATSLELWNIKIGGKTIQNHCSFYAVQQSRQEVYDIVKNAMREIGSHKWQQQAQQQNMWNLLWMWTTKVRIERNKLLVWQRMNHYTNVKQLTRKDLLGKHVTRLQRLPGRKGHEFDLVPATFVLPQDYIPFCTAFDTSTYWIMKPVSSSRGRGIRVIDDITEVQYRDHMIIQKYIDNPLLLRGYKFDLRLYILVTSFHPLEAFLYSEGFARICSEKFKLSKETIANTQIHLTNTAVNQGQGHEESDGTSKISLETLKYQLRSQNQIDFDREIWPSISELVVKSLCCVEEHIGSQPTCFELFGYDVMIDENLRPWLIEVNASPSMECYSSIDDIKRDMITDTIQLVDPLYFDRQILLDVINRRMRNNASRHQQQNKSQIQDELNQDLTKILHGKFPRQYGQMPEKLGRYQRIAPSKIYTKINKLRHM
jgi:hypothetical protein